MAAALASPPVLPMRGPDALVRAGEITTKLPLDFDAGIYFLGLIRTPWRERGECPRRGDSVAGPVCRIEIGARWREALSGLKDQPRLEVLYWMHLARRDLVRQNPKQRGELFGTFALRSPMRFNPISSSLVTLVGVEPKRLLVRGLDCVDGTPVVDIKPIDCPMWVSANADPDRRA